MRTILAGLILLSAALAYSAPPFNPTAPVAKVSGGNNIVVQWDQSQYGTSSEVCLWYSNGGTNSVGSPPLRKITAASGGTATFSSVLPGLYYATVISEQTRKGSGSEQVQIP